MKWVRLTSDEQLQSAIKDSETKTVLIFKHSMRCSISRTVLDRLERAWEEEEMKFVQPYFLDLLAYRDLSNNVAEMFDVEHESPQVLVIKNGKAVYHNSHFGIDYSELKKLTN